MPADNLPALLKAAALAVIAGLPMASDDPGFRVGGRVQGQIDPDDSNAVMPYWAVVSQGAAEETLGGDSEWQYKAYNFRAYLVDRRGPKDHARDDQYRSWRQEVLDEFHERRPVTEQVPACYWCEARPLEPYEVKAAKFQHVQGGLVLRFYVRTPRHAQVPLTPAGLRPAAGAG